MHELGRIDSRGPGRPRQQRRSLIILVAALTLGACSSTGGGGDIGEPPLQGDDAVEPVDAGPDLVPTPNDNADDGNAMAADGPTTTEFDLAAQPTTPPIDPIPETGVPGIDSADAFCRAWSEFAGSFQVLGLVSAIGDPANAFRLEVIAASAVTTALEAMEANLPVELEAERIALVVEFAGPFFNRALLAEVDLLDAGVNPDVLRDAWLATVGQAGVDDPTVTVDLPADIDAAAFDAAVVSFSSSQLAIVGDPALITNASIPVTEAYLAEVCPDGGILSGNDVIGG
jgi:hypothetical protein